MAAPNNMLLFLGSKLTPKDRRKRRPRADNPKELIELNSGEGKAFCDFPIHEWNGLFPLWKTTC